MDSRGGLSRGILPSGILKMENIVQAWKFGPQVNQSLRYTISNWKFLKTYILLFRLIRRDWT